ncbi:cation:proton antiporter [Candidatus Synchoanobacter obligatus]|uniref:Cation:proton antiporter n=1 Tax=Candidatus Synchoanobacter obligatus TaxID=2919597 RepID=A0ABT1L495_9GAMM|nr:cation:proton antiporter [Candidatus Synchoanobacter obligatus]MCP8352002.1 cation:proton antiporter [Candidatus Synchoanobacter obligatus]
MLDSNFLFIMFAIFFGAAVLSTFALFSRQSLMIAYILLGILLGPWGVNIIPDASMVEEIGNTGVIFLLFLLGLHLDPMNMLYSLKRTSWVTIASAVLFLTFGYGIGMAFGLSSLDSIVLGLSMMFSSTIISLKLLPSGLVHNTRIGEFMIGVLLIQDLIAMMALLMIPGLGGNETGGSIGLTILGLPFLILVAFTVEKVVLSPLFDQFERNREYLFLLAIAWCLGMAQLSEVMSLSHEMGAFIAGVAVASDSRVSLYLAKSLEPLRDFFLVMFFFSVGAMYDFSLVNEIYMTVCVLVVAMLLFKPYVFRILMVQVGEPKPLGWELGSRLGQGSEFSLLMVKVAIGAGVLSAVGASVIQGFTVLSFILSSFYVVREYPTSVSSQGDNDLN